MSDAAGNAATPVTRTVVVADTVAPVITLLGDAELTLEVGDTFTDAGATATDAVDGDLSDDIVVTGSIDTTSVGSYTLNYNVSDAAGNAAAEVTRTVVVEAIPITLVIPNDLVINAVGFLTGVNLDPESVASATDGDGKVINVVADQVGPFQSGSYDIVWSATSAGNTVSATQSLKIVPLVNLATAITTTEGNSLELKVLLSGNAADYPVTVPYTVSGTAVEVDDYTVDPSGSVTITEGTVAIISLVITADAIAESEETVVITLGESTNAVLGGSTDQVITITEQNLPPQVTLQVSQADVVGSNVSQDAGTVTVTAHIVDANAADTHTIDWTSALTSLPEAVLITVEGDGPQFPYEALQFNPADLDVGVYTVPADVTDGVNTVTVETNAKVIAVALGLSDDTDTDGDGVSDAEEGRGDSDGDGILGYQDNIDQSNVTPLGGVVVESEPGTTLILGTVALGAGDNNVSITEEEIAALTDGGDASYDYPADLIDFAATGAEFGHVYMLTVPLSIAIPEGAVYRKYSAVGGWANFVENATNAVNSAMAVEGTCPVGNSTYTPGLTAGDTCLQLLLEDGGPNDADGVGNGTLVDPGGLAIKFVGTPSESSTITLSDSSLRANGSDTTIVTVTVINAEGVGLEHMLVAASVGISGTTIGDFVDEGFGVYTATLTAGSTAGSAAVVAVIDSGEVNISISSATVTLNAVAVIIPPPAPSSGGGGCTVAADGSNDASLLLLLMMAGMLLARRRHQLR